MACVRIVQDINRPYEIHSWTATVLPPVTVDRVGAPVSGDVVGGPVEHVTPEGIAANAAAHRLKHYRYHQTHGTDHVQPVEI